MASSFVLKKLVVGSTRSVVVPAFRPASLQIHPRTFFSGVLDRFSARRLLVYGMGPDTASKLVYKVLKFIPHTMRTTTRVSVIDYNEEGESLGKPMKYSINVPGIEKIMETSQGLDIFIDLGLKLEAHEFDDMHLDASVCTKLNLLHMKGYVEKQDVRRHYAALICLPWQTEFDNDSIQGKIKDGGISVTVPNLVD